jgi:hypothetical protein
MNNYAKVNLDKGAWIITEKGHDYKAPLKACTFAIDTETKVYFDGKLLNPSKLFKKVRNLNNDQKRQRLSNVVWAWQVYDEVNGFFMTNSFEEFLAYQCRASLKFGWCYNSTFDFAQIDYEILATGKDKWKPHVHERGKGKGYDKGQAWTYESIHNDMGARYAYKLWIPYRNQDRHEYVHAIEYRDFMKLVAGGLGKLLKDLDVKDNEGNPIRKLEMDYQEADMDNPQDSDIDYCRNDVKGLYFAIKQFNGVIEQQTAGELHIYGEETNLMTAGGFAKSELLRSIYPNLKSKKKRIKQFQKEHPITRKQDEYVRNNHLYRGGISFVNPFYRGKLLTKQTMKSPMYRYDVNSEYPYAMSIIRDLVGKPFKLTFDEYDKLKNKADYEAIYVLKSVSGHVRENYLGFWYDPFRKDFVEDINETGTHLMFKREFEEMLNWYDDLEFTCDNVILIKRGGFTYKPYVEKNYASKAQAKKDHNATLQKVAKLLLNSSYGKLSERLERVIGHYALNEQTGAIHFVTDSTETDTASSMNVIIGALVTATARTFILSKIREICGDDIKHRFVYIDTDSIHAFANYAKADAYTLGGLKCEAVCDAVKYIAPKTYIDVEKVNKDGTIDYDKFEVHSKGINLAAIIADLKKKQKGKKHNLPTLDLISRKIAYGAKYICLVAMNVKGGKVLIPTEKYLARMELAPKNSDSALVINNMEGNILMEV